MYRSHGQWLPDAELNRPLKGWHCGKGWENERAQQQRTFLAPDTRTPDSDAGRRIHLPDQTFYIAEHELTTTSTTANGVV